MSTQNSRKRTLLEGTIHQTHDSEPSVNLPQAMITEILLRLPVKSLLKFRCVSKSWLSLISSPRFIKTHFEISTDNNIYYHNKLIFNSDSAFHILHTCSFYPEIDENPIMDTVPIYNPLSNPQRLVRIVGSCNGLICVVLEPGIVTIFNPTTRKSRKLPISGTSNSHAKEYGFGYDESNDDYKVVEFSWTTLIISAEFENEVKVYSSKTNSWRTINGPAGFVVSDCSVFVNRAIHWKLYPNGNPMDWSIIAFNVTTDRYKMVAKPKYETGLVNSLLVVSAGQLCVSCLYFTHEDIWEMKEYEVEESWTKLVKVPTSLELKMHINTRSFFVSENGDVLLKNGFSIVLYKPLQFHEIHPLNKCIEIDAKGYIFYVATYTESLVFPDFGWELASKSC
ncbi:F-box/kelch-repeat protein At3g23880-like [Olea europaea var. sylvestris]|uniref:F-box/kelch-repeat protein At3g23880-like n=1 Tax=Olea europaea var. sylvestris TaxID=158386 RepID=UPI000C1D7109|nr:F-box/kelch-repeat protein At3g23880-like [Olea europaea var. sylvestris]